MMEKAVDILEMTTFTPFVHVTIHFFLKQLDLRDEVKTHVLLRNNEQANVCHEKPANRCY